MVDLTDKKTSTKEFLSGGEMGRLIREFDWSGTSLGPPAKWSESLKSVVSIMLINRFPMLLWWGKEYIQIYNDAYIPVLGMKHPKPGLGSPGYECWDEIWDVLGPLVDTPFNGGAPTWMDDILLKVNRNNRVEETHFTIAYSPVPDPTAPNGIGGVLATVNEITEEIISKRQMETLRKLGKGISSTPTEEEVYKNVASVLAENKYDIPFAFIHQLNDDGQATVVATVNISRDHPAIKEPRGDNSVLSVSSIDETTKDLPMGAWDLQPRNLIHLPVRGPKGKTVAMLTIAQSPYRQFDDLYSNFAQLISDQISLGVNTASAFRQEQERAEALAEVDKAKTLFFGNVSHEFRTPLTLLLGPINDLLAKDSSSIIVAEREVLALVQRNAWRLQKLVNSLLDFSRIEAGKYQASFQPIDVSKLTAELASNFQSLMAKAGLQFEVDCPDIREEIYVDPGMWEKIVLNLISNAFKFTFEGKISVKTRLAGDHVEMIVGDTGVGIRKENFRHLFERFHRVENVRSRTHEGSGIGLALVNELVRMHGGSITVDSAEGKGTTFTVSIPLGYKHLPAEQIVKKSDRKSDHEITSRTESFKEEASRWMSYQKQDNVEWTDSNKAHVLLAEDNADMQMYIKKILADICEVHPVSNGRQAMEMAKKLRPDLVLTDVMMPEVDGLGLLKALRKDPVLQTVPVILLSARAGEEARIEGLQSGADDYLTKPFGRNELIARVTSNLQLSKLRREAQQAVRFSEAKLRALVNATSDVIYRMSPDWKTMFQLDGRNFLKDTGLPLADWQEKYIHPKDRGRVSKAIQEAITNRTMFQLEHQVIRNDGTLGWTFSRAIPIMDDNGEIMEWFGAASDISDRKFYQTELEARVEDRTKALNKANSELQVSNDDLQQFAHVASHDLKEPLRKIKTFALRIREEHDSILPDKAKIYIDRVLTAADRMSTMIDGVLTYSSLNGGGFMMEVIDLNEIIGNIRSDLELMIDQKKATLVSAGLPEVHGGRVLIHQLFYNLINNSLKFSEDGRPPVIRIETYKEKRDNRIYDLIRISDNGIGFDQTQSNRIFETFTRLHSKDQYDGTGLGLALCKKIVERHNGRIWAEGKRDVGATFVIELPSIQ
jgi:signal transduction histidine kinase/CheY-like chemotaxis protein